MNTKMKYLPTTVISRSLDDQLDWPHSILDTNSQELTYRPTFHP